MRELAAALLDPQMKSVTIKGVTDLSIATLRFSLSLVANGMDTKKYDFAYKLRSQELVMAHAHCEAFVTDTLRHVCLYQPAVLRTAKKTH